MAEISKAPIDTLVAGAKKFKVGAESRLYDLVGKDLYDIFYKKEIERDMPFGIKSKYDFKNRNLSFGKENIFKGWDARLDLEKKKWEFNLSKDF